MKRLNSLKRHSGHDKKNLALLTEIADGKIQLRTQIGIEICDEIWDKICIKHIGESCKNCTYIHNCQYSEMRSRLQYECYIVICNQNMLVSHLVNKSNDVHGIFNPSANIIVVDEAHNIESKFRDAYTKRITKQQIKSEIAKAEKSPKGKKCDTKKLHDDLNSIFASLKHDINLQRRMSEGTTKTYYFNCGEFLKEKLFSVRKAMAELERKSGVKLESLAFLRELSFQKKNSLVWLEYDDELTFCVCKKDIRKEISSLLFRKGISTILTSATLSGSGNGSPIERCRYFLDTLNYPINYSIVPEPKKSPFDYENNTILYISPNMPYPKYGIEEKEKYAEASVSEIIELLNITQGKALILFTAKNDMNYVFRKLSNMRLPYKVMMQSEHSSQQRKLDKFKTDTNSVILGSGIFWEGINIEGESLSQVIIFKLPFPAPDPIIDYKMSKAKEPLLDVAVPEMIIRLRQGVGRLIRSSQDKGIVSIIDPRLNSRSNAVYKERTLAAFPFGEITEDIEALQKFWDKINGE